MFSLEDLDILEDILKRDNFDIKTGKFFKNNNESTDKK